MNIYLKNKVKNYLEMYFKGDCDTGKILLENIILNGSEFLEASESFLKNLEQGLSSQYIEKERVSDLFDKLEKIVSDKEGDLIDKLNEIIKEGKELDYE